MASTLNVVVQVRPPSVLFINPEAAAYSVKGCDGLTTNERMVAVGIDRGVHEPPPLVLMYSVDGVEPVSLQAYITSGFDGAITRRSTAASTIPALLGVHDAPPSTLFMIAPAGSAASRSANSTFDAPGRTIGTVPLAGNGIHVAPPSMLLRLFV